jgi:hypothetical protein
MFRANFVEEILANFIFNNHFFENVPFTRQCGKIFRAAYATDENMAQAHFMLDTQGYKITFSINMQ